MAGYLPDVPGVRVPYHLDGSLVQVGVSVMATPAIPAASPAWAVVASPLSMNDGDISTSAAIGITANSGFVVSILFPQPITVLGYLADFANILSSTSTNYRQAAYSLDTTNGIDGTWTALAGSDSGAANDTVLRQSIVSCNIPNVRGFRQGGGRSGTNMATNCKEFAVYGEWTPAGLHGWHPTLDERLAGPGLDFGNVPVGTVHVKTFRVKNFSTQTANSVVISVGGGTAPMKSALEFSTDGSTWGPTATIPSIAPGAVSGLIQVRRTVGLAEAPNVPGTTLIHVSATSWT